MTGKCSKGIECKLQHRPGKVARKRTNSGGRPPKGLKRRKSDPGDVGGSNKVDLHDKQAAADSQIQTKGKCLGLENSKSFTCFHPASTQEMANRSS